jgi:hypothetical protein
MIRFAVFIVLIFLAVLIVADNVGRPIPHGYRILAGMIVAFGIAAAMTSG